MTARDTDADDNITGYAISGGADQAKFSIDSTTGALSFKEAPNFENPTDMESTTPVNAEENNEYIVVVEATSGTGDRALTAQQTLTVTVSDVNEAPVISSNDAFDVVENTTQVGTVVANDVDGADSITGFTLSGGADQAKFSITNGGVLTFKEAPNFENPTDVESTTPVNAEEDNEYLVVVEATGGAGERALTAEQTITVTVSDVDTEAPGKPSAPTIVEATLNSLKISWSAPTNTGPEISAYDVRHILSSASEQDKADGSKWMEQVNAWTSGGGSLEHTITGLSQDTGHDVQVRAENAEGTGDWSNSGSGMTTVPGFCARTEKVQSAILLKIDGVNACGQVTTAHLGAIGTLDFRNQSITALKANDFSGLSNLTVLRLDKNELSTLPAGVFSGLSSLQTLRLERNSLTALPAGVFSGLSNLQGLELDRNELSTLPADVFSGLSSLQTLHLERNSLTALPAGVFSGLSSLQGLKLDTNLGAPFTLRMVLERTDNTDLTAPGPATVKVKVAQGAPFNMTVNLSAENGTLTDGEGTPVTQATISAGSLESEAITVTQSNTQHVTVNLANASSPPSQYTGLQTSVGDGLDLFPAQGICGRTAAVQTRILSAIQDVTDCAEVTDNHLAGISGLLNLSNRGITSLRANDFSGLSSLQVLHLDGNSLSTLPDGVFSDLSSLQRLSLSENSLSTLPDDVFTGLSSLQVLHLDGNSLSTLPDGVFTGLSSLQNLWLYDNDLSTLPDGVFSDLSSLQRLSLSENSLSTLPDGVFTDLSSLQRLSLSENSLSTLPDGVFTDLSSLQSLYLRENSLSTLPDGVFTDLFSLEHLDLSGNTGAPFTLTLMLERTDNTSLTAPGPATVKVKVAQGAPFDMTVGLSAENGTLTNDQGTPVTQATISAGSLESEAITATQSSTALARVHLGRASDVPVGHEGLQVAVDKPLVLFGEEVNRAPRTVGSIAAQTLRVGGNAVQMDVEGNFSDPDIGDALSYTATSNMSDVASVSVTQSIVTITPVSAGRATVTVTASDKNGLNTTQEFEVLVKNTAPVVDKGLADQTAFLNSPFTFTFPTDAFSDADEDDLTFTSIGHPTWLAFTPSSRTFSGTPLNTDGSPFTIIVTADDGKESRVQASFILTVPIGICSRTSEVQTAILSVIDGVNDCRLVTEEHLAGIVDSLNLRSQKINALKADDFSGMHNLRILNFYDNDLTSLPSKVFSGLSNLRFLSLFKNDLTTLPSGVFSGLSNLRFVSVDSNLVMSTLPAGVFSGLSNLETLSLSNNVLAVLPADVFNGLSSLSHLDLSGNTGAPFTLTLMLERTDNTDLTATGPATVVVKVAQGAPFDMTVGLSAENGTLTDGDANAITEVTILRGNIQSGPITVTQDGTISTTVNLGSAPSLPLNYIGLQIKVGTSLVLFEQ